MKRLLSILIVLISLIPLPYKAWAGDLCATLTTRSYNKNFTLDPKDMIENVYSRVTDSWDSLRHNSRDLLYDFTDWCDSHKIANSLTAAVSIGDMGIGLEVKTPITKWVDLRAGIAWVPRFKVLMRYNLNTYKDGVPTGNFDKIAQMVYDNTGIEMDAIVRMYGVGSMVNFKLLADIFPIPSNRHWHLTAGFYEGTAHIGKAYNAKDEKPTLVGLNVYNRGYEYFTNLTDIFNVPLGNNTYMDPDVVENLQNKFRNFGRIGVKIGYFKDGTPYIMEPAPDGSVSANAFIKHFKPYLGAGYSTSVDKEGKWHIGVDLGVLFWGGAPNVIYHDYSLGKDISFTHDLVNIRGKVGRNMNIIKSFPVWPVLEISFSYTIL